ncbi:purine-rich element-binding protein gamma [Sarotherodon galilaeus]
MLITYLLAVTGSLVNIIFIVSDKQLHKPMYLLICNLAVVDILYTSRSTLVSHLICVICLYCPMFVIAILTRFGVVLTLEERQGLLIGTILGPSLVNPLVYCLRTKEIKNKIVKIFRKVNTAG